MKIKYTPFYLFSFLPYPFLKLLSYLGYLLLYYLLAYRKKVVFRNLKICFPQKTNSEIKFIAQNFYLQFSRSFLETLKGITMSQAQFKKRYSFINSLVLKEVITKKKSIMLYGSHFGNWEWMSFLPEEIGQKMFSFFTPVRNAYFNEFMLQIRQRFGIICLESRQGPRQIIENRASNIHGVYFLIGDQSPHVSSSYEWFNFFSRETAFLMGAPKLASRFEMVSFYVKTTLKKSFHYEIEFVPFPKTNNVIEMAQFYIEQLEKSIREEPHLWLWSHRRWKLKPSKSK